MALISYEKLYESTEPLTRAKANLIFLHAPGNFTLKEVRLLCANGSGTFGTWVFNLKVNGTPIFVGADKPRFLGGQPSYNVVKTGLSVPVVVGQPIALDLETTGQGRINPPLALVLVFDDGKGGSAFSVNLTTGSLADLAYETGTISFGEAFTLEQVVRDYNCRVQLYQTAAARTADASRPIGTDPSNIGGNGIICDLNLESGEPLRWQMAPPAAGYNGDVPEQSVVYYRVQNRSGATRAINLTFIGTIERKK